MKHHILTLLVLCVAASGAHAQLDPPAGPIVKTGKTLIEIEPRIAVNATNTPGDADSMFKITVPGSYYLTGNIAGVIGKHGIEIEASGVTLDLNGFVVRGLGTISGAFDGVFAPSGVDRVTIRNGHIESMGRHGINLSLSGACVVEDVTASLCQGSGIFVAGRGRVNDCTATGNEGTGSDAGIRVGPGGSVTGCTADSNAGSGIFALLGARVTDSVAYDNAGIGIRGNGANNIKGCTSYLNDGTGIDVDRASVVTDCTVYANGGYGLNLTESSVTDCIVNDNALSGIRVANSSTIRGCTLHGNQASGILVVADRNRITDNQCSDNDIGILVEAGSSRTTIDGNSFVRNGVNIDVDGVDNIIVRNTASQGNPNYSIVAGNSVAPRVGVVGSDGWAGIANGDHPWANFGY